MEKKREYPRTDVFSPIKPDWIDPIPAVYYNDVLEYYNFFVLHAICKGQSIRQKTFTDYCWEFDPFKKNYLLHHASKGLFLDSSRIAPSKKEFKDVLAKHNLLYDFPKINGEQKFAAVHVYKSGCNNALMCVLYHIRNAFAHGRFSIVDYENCPYIIIEDGKKKGLDKDNRFEVTFRMIVTKSTLDDLIYSIKNPPKIQEKVFQAINAGIGTKEEITKAIRVEAFLVDDAIISLRSCKAIEYNRKQRQWIISERK